MKTLFHFVLFSFFYFSDVGMAHDKGGKPNLILILADDLGYGDVGAFGGDIPTPHIDSLARDGIMLSNFHVPAAVCTPTRSGIHSGIHPARFGLYCVANRGTPLPEIPALPELLRNEGYHTGMVGRWDMGSADQGPFELGYNEVAKRPDHPQGRPGPTYLGDDGAYWTENNYYELSDFIGRNAHHPFFLYYSPLAVHFPVTDAPQHFLDRVPAHITHPRRRALAGTLIALDDAVGSILKALERNGLAENTFIFFTSDNGGELTDHASNAPWRGGKATYYEGGFRMPTMARWPGKIPAGTVFDGLSSGLDILPTLVAAAGGEAITNRDGKNLLPFLKLQAFGDVHESLYFRYYSAGGRIPYKDMRAIRSGPWRYLEFTGPVNPSTGTAALYRIASDPGERHNLIDEQPEIAARLRQKLIEWDAGNPPLPTQDHFGTADLQAEMPRGRGWVIKEQ